MLPPMYDSLYNHKAASNMLPSVWRPALFLAHVAYKRKVTTSVAGNMLPSVWRIQEQTVAMKAQQSVENNMLLSIT